MRQGKIWNILYAVLWGLQLAVEGLTVFTVWRLNMLPDQYLLMLVAVFVLLWCLTGLLLLIPSKKKNGGRIRRGIACALVLLITVGCAAVVTVVSDLHDTLDNVTDDQLGDGEDEITRSIYVLADDPAQTLMDAKGYSFAVVEGYDEAYVEQVLAHIEQEHGEKPNTVSYISIPAMVDGLYAQEVDAIIVNEANLAILEEEAGYSNFHDKAKLLCEVAVEERFEGPTEPTAPSETDPVEATESTEPIATEPPVTESQDITNTPFIVYIAGSDTRSSKLSNSRNDVNILAVVNPETKQVLLINTPRDYYVPNYAGNGKRDKLAHCGNYGINNSIKALEYLYGDRIDLYAQINFKGFEKFIDAIGGVTVDSDISFTTIEGFRILKGENKLDGEKALAFARERKAFADGDNVRGKNQMKVIKAVIQKMTSGTTIITKYADILDSLSGMFRTNLSMDDLSLLVKMQLNDMASWDILSYAVTGMGKMDVTYSAPGMELYVTVPNQKTVDHANDLIDRILAGEILTQDDIG